MVTVQFDRSEEGELKRFFRRNGGDWPVVKDPDGRIALDYGVTGIPESYLIDPAGVVVSKVVGGISADGLEALIQGAVQQQETG